MSVSVKCKVLSMRYKVLSMKYIITKNEIKYKVHN
mgnify:CR=1 FL=1